MVTVPSKILGPDGQPIQKEVLAREVAAPTVAGVRRVHEERVASGLTPEKLGSILRDAAEGNARAYLTLAEEMEERYLHYASQLQTRRLAIESVDITIEADKGVPSKIIDAVNELVEEPGFRDAVGALTDGIAKGLAVVELMWEYERKALRPVEFKFRDQRFFQFDKLSLSELRLAVDGSIEGEPLPPAKFLRHLPRAKMGIPYRRGVARPAAFAFMLQNFGLQDWAGFSEVYGMPLRVGKYHPGASEADKRTLLKAVASIANDAAAIIPDGMSIDFHEVSGTQGEAVFGGLLGYVDKQISKLVVGQTMTSDDGASLGQAKIHNEVRLDILRADCRQLAAGTITRDLIIPFVAMNYGVQDIYPRAEMPVPDPEDIETLTKAVQRLVPLGLKVGQREVREKIGLSEPADDDELLAAPKGGKATADEVEEDDDDAANDNAKKIAPAKKSPKFAALAAQVADHKRSCRCRSCVTVLAAEAIPASGIDEVDALLEAAAGDWQATAAPIVAPLMDILEKATTFDEALAMLEAKGPDAGRMAEQLARLGAIARGVGDTRD